MSYCRKCGYRYHPNSDADECSNCGRQRYDDPCPDCAALRQQLAKLKAADALLKLIYVYAPMVPIPLDDVERIHALAAAAIHRAFQENRDPADLLARVQAGITNEPYIRQQLADAQAQNAKLRDALATIAETARVLMIWEGGAPTANPQLWDALGQAKAHANTLLQEPPCQR